MIFLCAVWDKSMPIFRLHVNSKFKPMLHCNIFILNQKIILKNFSHVYFQNENIIHEHVYRYNSQQTFNNCSHELCEQLDINVF